jgi:hypothetical protein
MLTQHPDIERRLREEIFAKVGPTESPTYEQIREMTFMRAFLNGIISRAHFRVPMLIKINLR